MHIFKTIYHEWLVFEKQYCMQESGNTNHSVLFFLQVF